MCRFCELETVIASETKQSIGSMDRRTAFAMTDDEEDDSDWNGCCEDPYDDEDEEEQEREWCD